MLASRPLACRPLCRVARRAKVYDHSNLNILTLKQMLQRLPTAQVKIR